MRCSARTLLVVFALLAVAMKAFFLTEVNEGNEEDRVHKTLRCLRFLLFIRRATVRTGVDAS
jgi:hypothetical protein